LRARGLAPKGDADGQAQELHDGLGVALLLRGGGMNQEPRHFLSGVIVVLLGVCLPCVCAGQSISGRVLEESSGRPVAGAAVSLVDRSGKTKVQVLADSVGQFLVAPPQAGDYRLLAERLGCRSTLSPLLSLKLEGTVELDLIVDPEPIGLEGLEVSTESEAVRSLRSYGHTPAELGSRWIDRKKIEAVRSALRPSDVIRWQGIAGIHVRVSNASPALEPLCVETLRSGHPGCALTVLNGVIVDPVEVNQLDPSAIESIAVLSPVDAATLFGTRGGNGAVLVWMRTGGR